MSDMSLLEVKCIHTGLSTSWLWGSDGDWFSLTLARLAGFSAGWFWKSVGDRLCVTTARLAWTKVSNYDSIKGTGIIYLAFRRMALGLGWRWR
jgi:hypothetical protein